MKRSVFGCVLCCTLLNSFSQNIPNTAIDSIVSVIQKVDNCSISYDSSTFKNGFGGVSCFSQNKSNQKLVRITEKTILKTRNKKITRDYYFYNDNLIKVEAEEGSQMKTFYYSNNSAPNNTNDRESQFYLNLARIIQKSFYKKFPKS